MLINASASNPENGPGELLAVRMTISNAIVDPWIYIILRKENLVKISKLIQRVRKSKHMPAIFTTKESNATGACAVSNLSTPSTRSTQLWFYFDFIYKWSSIVFYTSYINNIVECQDINAWYCVTNTVLCCRF